MGTLPLAQSPVSNAHPLEGPHFFFFAPWRAGCPRWLWDPVACTQVGVFVGHQDWVNCLAFRPDGKQLLSGGSGGTLWLWDVATKSKQAGPGRVFLYAGLGLPLSLSLCIKLCGRLVCLNCSIIGRILPLRSGGTRKASKAWALGFRELILRESVHVLE